MDTLNEESAFWALKGAALAKGINPARMGQLAKLCNDFKRARSLLTEVLKAKAPSTYLGAVIAKMKEDLKPPALIKNEPEVVLYGRLHGWPVRKTVLSTGKPGWWVSGVLYNQEGVDVGA